MPFMSYVGTEEPRGVYSKGAVGTSPVTKHSKKADFVRRIQSLYQREVDVVKLLIRVDTALELALHNEEIGVLEEQNVWLSQPGPVLVLIGYPLVPEYSRFREAP